MLTSGWNNPNNMRLPFVLPNLGNTTQRQPLLQNASHRPASTDSVQSIDNAYSLEHLFTALRRRIRRLVQSYNITAFYNALKICARIFRSYASYNLHTIDKFAQRLSKGSQDNKKLLIFIDQFRQQLSELRHCYSTFEIELLVTTLAIDFHENEFEQQSLPLLTGKFSPRSRFSKYRLHHIRQATELKSQLRQTNENLQILLYDEFNANLSTLWDESDKYLSASIPFYDHHMTYVLRLIPDIALKFEYALQLCSKLFELETAMLESSSQINPPQPQKTSQLIMRTTATPPRLEYNQQKLKSIKNSRKSSDFTSIDITRASSVSSDDKLNNTDRTPVYTLRREEPVEIIEQRNESTMFSTGFNPTEKSLNYKNDQTKLRLLIDQFEKRLTEEEAYRQRLVKCVKRTAVKAAQLKKFPKSNMLALVMTDDPAVVEYQKALCASDYQVHKSVSDELNIALRETQYRIDWINMVRSRAKQCLI